MLKFNTEFKYSVYIDRRMWESFCGLFYPFFFSSTSLKLVGQLSNATLWLMSGSLGLIVFVLRAVTSDLILMLLKQQTLTNQRQSNLFVNQIIPLTDSNGFSCRTSLVKRPCLSLLYGELRTRIDKHCNKTTTSQASQNTTYKFSSVD